MNGMKTVGVISSSFFSKWGYHNLVTTVLFIHTSLLNPNRNMSSTFLTEFTDQFSPGLELLS